MKKKEEEEEEEEEEELVNCLRSYGILDKSNHNNVPSIAPSEEQEARRP